MAKFQTFQFEEQGGRILFLPPYVRRSSGSDSNIVNNSDGSVIITDYTWVMNWTPDGSGFATITPGKTYYYDITYSNTSGNQFYIGIEKYDSNKASSGSNEECQYQVNDSSARDHYRVFGTVSITSANGNTPAYVRLRILNAWNGSSSSKVATIHECIYRELDNLENLQMSKNSALCNTFVETNCIEGIRNNGITSFNELIEI